MSIPAPSLQYHGRIYARSCPRCSGAIEYRNEDPFTRSLRCLCCGWSRVTVTPLSGRSAGLDAQELALAAQREAMLIRGRAVFALYQQGMTYQQIASRLGLGVHQVRWALEAVRAENGHETP